MHNSVILLAVTLVIYIVYRIYKSNETKREKDILNALRDMSLSLKHFDETLGKLAERKDFIGADFKKAKERIDKGEDVEKVLIDISKNKSFLFKCLTDSLIISHRTEADISRSAFQLSEKILFLEDVKARMDSIMRTSAVLMQLIGIMLIPLMYIIMASILGFELTKASFVFMGIVAFVISSSEFIVYNNLAESLFLLPLGMSLFYFITSVVAPFMLKFIEAF